MADNRSQYQIAQAHAQHVRDNGHATLSMFQLDVKNVSFRGIGSVQLEVCTECPFMRVQCNHEKNSWDAEGKNLTCDLCGMDGT